MVGGDMLMAYTKEKKAKIMYCRETEAEDV